MNPLVLLLDIAKKIFLFLMQLEEKYYVLAVYLLLATLVVIAVDSL